MVALTLGQPGRQHRALSGGAVTLCARFSVIAPAAVLGETARGWRAGRRWPGGSRSCPSDGGLDPLGSEGGARGGMLRWENKAHRTC